MRPCPRCGTAIPNKAVTCGECIDKPAAPLLAPCRTVPHDELDLKRYLSPDDASGEDFTLISTAVVGVLSLPLALCYLSFGTAGLAAGLLVGAALFVVFWSAMGGC